MMLPGFPTMAAKNSGLPTPSPVTFTPGYYDDGETRYAGFDQGEYVVGGLGSKSGEFFPGTSVRACMDFLDQTSTYLASVIMFNGDVRSLLAGINTFLVNGFGPYNFQAGGWIQSGANTQRNYFLNTGFLYGSATITLIRS